MFAGGAEWEGRPLRGCEGAREAKQVCSTWVVVVERSSRIASPAMNDKGLELPVCFEEKSKQALFVTGAYVPTELVRVTSAYSEGYLSLYVSSVHKAHSGTGGCFLNGRFCSCCVVIG